MSIDGLASDFDGEAEWDLANLTGSPSIGSRSSTRSNCAAFREVGSVVCEAVPLSVSGLSSLAVRCLEALSRAFFLEGHVGPYSRLCDLVTLVFGKWSRKLL